MKISHVILLIGLPCLSAFLCFENYGYPYKVTAWMKKMADGHIKTVINLYDVHLDKSKLIDRSIVSSRMGAKEEALDEIDQYHDDVMKIITRGCKQNKAPIIIEERIKQELSPTFRKIYETTYASSFTSFIKFFAMNSVKMIFVDHRGLFMHYFDKLSKSLPRAREFQQFVDNRFLDEIMRVLNITESDAFGIFTINSLRKNFFAAKDNILKKSADTQSRDEIIKLLEASESDFQEWMNNVKKLLSPYSQAEIETLPVDKLYEKMSARIKLDNLSDYELECIKEKCSIHYFMLKVFDAGLLLEVDRALAHHDNIVVFTGGQHAEKFDTYLRAHSYLNLEEFPKTIDYTKQIPLAELLTVPAKIKKCFDLVHEIQQKNAQS